MQDLDQQFCLDSALTHADAVEQAKVVYRWIRAKNLRQENNILFVDGMLDGKDFTLATFLPCPIVLAEMHAYVRETNIGER